VKPRDVVGYRIRKERERLGMSQAALAERMTALLSTEESQEKWYPQTVGAAEQGQRAFAVEDLVALSMALEIDPALLTKPPAGQTMDVGRHQVEDPAGVVTWTGQEVTIRVETPTARKDRLVADLERATQALVDYLKEKD
jgi:transcriptional regulator with XRE-family HTH domain